MLSFVFFFNDTATTEIYTLSLHDALPISGVHRDPAPRTRRRGPSPGARFDPAARAGRTAGGHRRERSAAGHVIRVCSAWPPLSGTPVTAPPASRSRRSPRTGGPPPRRAAHPNGPRRHPWRGGGERGGEGKRGEIRGGRVI